MTDTVWYHLRDAVYKGDFAAAEKFLDEDPSLRTLRNGIGETVLHSLAVENDLRGVSWLHAHGFSLNEQNGFGKPTVFEVAQLEYKELFVWFLENGADPFSKDREGKDLVAYLCGYEKDEMVSFVIDKVPNQERFTRRAGEEKEKE